MNQRVSIHFWSKPMLLAQAIAAGAQLSFLITCAWTRATGSSADFPVCCAAELSHALPRRTPGSQECLRYGRQECLRYACGLSPHAVHGEGTKNQRVQKLIFPLAASVAPAEGASELPPVPKFHLTARPWQPLAIPREAYLDAVEGACRFWAKHQDSGGAIIDPFLGREWQYSTPYFAASVGVLMQAGRSRDIWPQGIRAMDHATAAFAKGNRQIPQRHGEFFDAALAQAIKFYDGQVSEEKMRLWRERMKTRRDQIVQGPVNNWRTYAMRGEWLRCQDGLADRADTLAFISDCWRHGTQRERVLGDRWNLYHDAETDPESLAVEAVGRVNLLGLIAAGCDGPERGEIQAAVERATQATLLLQDPSGQAPPNGRADNHVWSDILYQLAFDTMAERAMDAGNDWLAGQYRHAAMLSFQSSRRWRRVDEEWDGSYYVTKNHFDPARRVGYQAASQYANYNGTVMLHLAQAFLARRRAIPEAPAPVEIGGYALVSDEAFSTVVANAGGMQMLVALRGDTRLVYDHYWTALGVERMGRVNWDTRLGPADGIRDGASQRGVTFGPSWRENGHWINLADVPERYGGQFCVQFVHPLLVRCAIDYKPLPGKTGPEFRHEFILTPDGILSTLQAKGTSEFALTCPLLENDGSALQVNVTDHSAITSYGANGDQQCFLCVGEKGGAVMQEPPLLSSYGWLRPVRFAAQDGLVRCFVYPRSAEDPPAESVSASFHLTEVGFESVLGRVQGTLYAGRTSAGGAGASIDCVGDNQPDAVFDAPCSFILQLRAGRVTAVEADRETQVRIRDQLFQLKPYEVRRPGETGSPLRDTSQP